jgi:hypothetical protein
MPEVKHYRVVVNPSLRVSYPHPSLPSSLETLTLHPGDIVSFDGSNLVHQDINYKGCGSFNSAIKAKWVVLMSEEGLSSVRVESTPPVARMKTEESHFKTQSRIESSATNLRPSVEGTNVNKLSADEVIRKAGANSPLRQKLAASLKEDPGTGFVGSIVKYDFQNKNVGPTDGVVLDPKAPTIRQGERIIEKDVASLRQGVFNVSPEALTPLPEIRQSKLDEKAAIRDVISDWPKESHWSKRVDEAVNFYGNSPNVLQAIFEIETPGVVQAIKAKLGLEAPPEPVEKKPRRSKKNLES